MRLSKNIVLGSLLGMASLAVYSKEAYAKVDIALEDNKEDKSITVSVNSNGSYIDGVNMNILFSEGMNISNVQLSEEFCSMGKSNEVVGTTLSLECFNEANVEMSGTLAKFNYSTDKSEYFFYVDDTKLDVGTLAVGNITDINKPVLESENDDTQNTEEAKSTLEQVRDFLTENSLYVLAGVIFLISCIVAIVGLSSKDEDNQQ
jgi:hypothetical protein